MDAQTPLPDDRLEAYPAVSTDKLRYADTDAQGHVNNAVFSTFLETGRVEIFRSGEGIIADPGCAFVIARLELDFLKEITCPGTVEIGTRVERIGRSSMTLAQGVFQDGVQAARARSVIVQMDEATRKSRALSRHAVAHLTRLMPNTA
ncbi:thioesterase family protein [Stappia sp.]|uniref:acyl-CoA thioesterase n=1 Tax=Stappia sp. TaxID=1870903 RepID=UPI0032D96D73